MRDFDNTNKDHAFLTKEQYKELDGLMTYILDDLCSDSNEKDLVREGIIAYANRWYKFQTKAKENNNV